MGADLRFIFCAAALFFCGTQTATSTPPKTDSLEQTFNEVLGDPLVFSPSVILTDKEKSTLEAQKEKTHLLRRLHELYCMLAKNPGEKVGEYHAPALAVLDGMDAVISLMDANEIAIEENLKRLHENDARHYENVGTLCECPKVP